MLYINIINNNLNNEEYLENKNYEDNEMNNEDNYNNVKVLYEDCLKEGKIEEVKTGITINDLNKKDIIINSKDNFDKTNKNGNVRKEGKKIGRKIKNSNEKGEHNKFCQDNIFKKIKSNLINLLIKFINDLIVKIYNGNIGYGIFTKKLKTLSKTTLNVKGNKELLNKSLKDILSDNISSKYTNYNSQHNKNLIEKLLNEEDLEKREIFINLFSLTFLECLSHFRGDKINPILNNLKSLNEFCKVFENEKEYLNLFKYYVFHFEEIIMRKRERNQKKIKN